MGSQDSAAAFGLVGTRFEPDEFYESFQAPKFHDFTAPEEPIDPDAFFLAQPTGMVLKKAVVLENVKMMAPKIPKVTVQDIPDLGVQRGSERVPPGTISTEKIDELFLSLYSTVAGKVEEQESGSAVADPDVVNHRILMKVLRHHYVHTSEMDTD